MTDSRSDATRERHRRAVLVVQVAEVRDLLEMETRQVRREFWVEIPFAAAMSLLFWTLVLLVDGPPVQVAMVPAVAFTLVLVLVAVRSRRRLALMDELQVRLDLLEAGAQAFVP